MFIDFFESNKAALFSNDEIPKIGAGITFR